MHKAFLIPAALAVTAAFVGCGRKPADKAEQTGKAAPSPEYIVAMVNGTPLIWADMEKRAMGYMKDDIETNHLIIPSNRLEEAKEHFRRKSVNAFVFKTIMMDEASKQKIRLTDADRQEGLRSLAVSLKSRNWTTNDFFSKGPLGEAMMRREFEDGLVIDKLLKLNVRNQLKIGDSDINATIAVIDATNDLKRAHLENIRKQILDGADFADTARNVSECPSAKNGGDLGELVRGKMPKPFEDAAFSQDIGAVGPVVASRLGFHIIKVTSRNPAKPATDSTPAIPESVRASHILVKFIPIDRKKITDSIVRTKFNAGVDTYFKDLKAKSKIECFLYPDMRF